MLPSDARRPTVEPHPMTMPLMVPHLKRSRYFGPEIIQAILKYPWLKDPASTVTRLYTSHFLGPFKLTP